MEKLELFLSKEETKGKGRGISLTSWMKKKTDTASDSVASTKRVKNENAKAVAYLGNSAEFIYDGNLFVLLGVNASGKMNFKSMNPYMVKGVMSETDKAIQDMKAEVAAKNASK